MGHTLLTSTLGVVHLRHECFVQSTYSATAWTNHAQNFVLKMSVLVTKAGLLFETDVFNILHQIHHNFTFEVMTENHQSVVGGLDSSIIAKPQRKNFSSLILIAYPVPLQNLP